MSEYRCRAKLGIVTVVDPQDLSRTANSMKINPHGSCEEPFVATQRASTLLGSTGLGESSSDGDRAQEAGVLLSRLLMACALVGKDVTTWGEWGTYPDLARLAIKILKPGPFRSGVSLQGRARWGSGSVEADGYRRHDRPAATAQRCGRDVPSWGRG